MRKGLITASVLGAAFAISALVDRGMYLGAIGCIGWIGFVSYANLKRPRAATRGKKENISTHQDSFRLYSLMDDYRFQERIRILKAKEDAHDSI